MCWAVFDKMGNLSLIVVISFSLIGFFVYRNWQYKNTAYYLVTRNLYSSVRQNRGFKGEYLIYKRLRHFEKDGGKFLFNIYLPKTNDGTSEIDVLLICSKGLFVFESKNYSGWIFGNEAHNSWTQTLPLGWNKGSHKERFYNPILQNEVHIRHLKRFIKKETNIWSVIVFSDECVLKDVTVSSDDVNVVNCDDVLSAVMQICDQTQFDILTHEEIDDIYTKLYGYTQVTNEVKQRHKSNLQKY